MQDVNGWEEEELDALPLHDCLEHLIPKSHEWTEPHGERCYQEWWECTECGEVFTGKEIDRLVNEA